MSKKKEEEEAEASTLKSAAEIAAERCADSTAELSSVPNGQSTDEMLQKEIKELRVEAAKARENWDRLLRTQADLENYRKRVARERAELIKSANEKLLLELLTPLDHFEKGLQTVQFQGAETQNDSLRQGMEIVLSQFQQFLKSHGVTEIHAIGQIFDPSLHEAVAYQESDLPEGQVVQQLRKGYRLRDKVLRHAGVIVSKGKPASESPSSDIPLNS